MWLLPWMAFCSFSSPSRFAVVVWPARIGGNSQDFFLKKKTRKNYQERTKNESESGLAAETRFSPHTLWFVAGGGAPAECQHVVILASRMTNGSDTEYFGQTRSIAHSFVPSYLNPQFSRCPRKTNHWHE
jgi:hypothetical protein